MWRSADSAARMNNYTADRTINATGSMVVWTSVTNAVIMTRRKYSTVSGAGQLQVCAGGHGPAT